MQGIHKEGEFRQLEIWTWKSYIRLPILHNSKQAETSRRIIMEYLMNIGANNYQRGPTRWGQPTWARQAPLARPGGLWPPRPTSGALLLVYKSFWPRKKIKGGLSGKAPSPRGGIWAGALLPSSRAIPPGNVPPGGGNHHHHHHQQLSHLGEGNLHQHLQQHHLLSNPSSSLVFNLCIGTIGWCLWVTSSVDYIL